jgi:hypothetical protein
VNSADIFNQLPLWLVDSLVEFSIDLSVLGWDRETMQKDFNRDIAPFDVDVLANVIRDNVEIHNLEISTNTFSLNRLTIFDVLALIIGGKPQTHLVGFTSHGGALWESLHNANWNRYIKYYTVYGLDEREDLKTLYIESISRERIRELHDHLPLIGYAAASSSSVAWTTLVDWDPTYWKTIPLAYQLAIGCTERGYDDVSKSDDTWLTEFLAWNT